jgi:hypothetical protein
VALGGGQVALGDLGAAVEGPGAAVGSAGGRLVLEGGGAGGSRGPPSIDGACYAKDDDAWQSMGAGSSHINRIHCFYF